MEPFDPPPHPPRPVPPAPPRPDLLRSAPRPSPGLTPMMDFFQRRLEALEGELAIEQERAASAQALLRQQDALKAEVDSHLKALSEQLRREKSEREGEEQKSHSRGRVEALERRLDEMNATFAQLLREAVSRQAPPSAPAPALPVSALAEELAVLRRTIKDVSEQVGRWREEMGELPAIVPEVRAVAQRLPEDEKRLEETVARRLDEISSRLATALSALERRLELERRQQDDRLQSLVEERASMARLFESQGQAVRHEFLKERIARETALSEQVAGLAARIEALSRGQQDAAATAAPLREALDHVLRALNTPPKVKDELIAELEGEKAELAKILRARQDELRRFTAERREVEKSLGDSLVGLTAELERERAATRGAQAQGAQAQGEIERLQARVAILEAQLAERDERMLSLGAERDELTRALVLESEKLRQAIAERTESDERWHQRVLELQRRVEEEAARGVAEIASAADLRAKVATLSEHMARALQERDAVIARFADWERERQRLLDALKQKDGMISMLSSAFQGALKKP